MKKRLNVFLTGYRGLAESFLSTFLENGHELHVLVRPSAPLAQLKERWPRVHFFCGNVEDQIGCQSWIDQAVRNTGPGDVLINNAAISGPAGKLDEIGIDEVERTLQVNLVSPLFLMQVFLRAAQHPITVLNLSGGGATAARPTFCAYAISKTALVRLTETAACEYPEHRFYAIAPGRLMTPMIEGILRQDETKVAPEDYKEAQRRLREGGDDPKKAAELALWLCEARPQSLNGKLIHAIHDDYRNEKAISKLSHWWTLRRIDELCQEQISRIVSQSTPPSPQPKDHDA